MTTSSRYYDVYGFGRADLERVRLAVERSLGVILELHESEHRGGEYYRLGLPGAENLELQRNFNVIESEYTEPDFREHEILLYVNGFAYPFDIERSLKTGVSSTRLLRRECL